MKHFDCREFCMDRKNKGNAPSGGWLHSFQRGKFQQKLVAKPLLSHFMYDIGKQKKLTSNEPGCPQ